MATALGSVTSDNFLIFLSLALLMLTVVFGIGYVTGALLGGVLSGVGFGIVVATFNHLGDRHVGLHGLYATLAHIAAVAPALIGIGVGRSPSGSVHDFIESYRPMRNAKPVLVAGAATEALLYLLALTGVLTNWWFAILTGVLALVLPVLGRVLMPGAFLTEEELALQREAVPVELVGIDTPYTPQVRESLDRALGLDGVPGVSVPEVAAPAPADPPVGVGAAGPGAEAADASA
jgi:branched-chain amino acid transport system permease protein